ncbi:MAG: DUF1592 domain-containing protein [Saprospiraceae bacterium]|nr:DUF1592 domain-containing protein [Saprospiraceae bacterium]
MNLSLLKFLGVACCLLGLNLVEVSADEKEDRRFRNNIRSVLRKHCTSCHNEAEKKGGVNLDVFDFVVHVVRRGDLFQKVIETVEMGAMPPSNRRAMSTQDRDSLVLGLRRILNNALLEPDPGEAIMRRLSHREYQYTIKDLVGIDFDARSFFPSEGSGGEGFDNQSRVLYVTPLMMERYYAAADSIMRKLKKDNSSWNMLVSEPYKPSIFRKAVAWIGGVFGVSNMKWRAPVEAAEKVLLPFAQKAYRRFLSADEEAKLLGFFSEVYFADWHAENAYESSLTTVLKRILVSPHFLFRYEANLPTVRPYPVSNFELATRLSYLLWSSMPDDTLMQVAYREDLHDSVILQREVDRMMRSLKFRRFTSSFSVQWLGVEESLLSPKADPDKFPELTPSLSQSMHSEVVDFFHYVFTEERNLLDLLDSDYGFLNQQLAAHYDLPPVEGDYVRKVAFADHRRGGVLGMGAVLMGTSLPLRTSPVLRGQWVLEQLLGDGVPPPPPDVPELTEERAGIHDELDLRTLLEKHRTAPGCMGCHKKMDPIGLGLENFDAIGRWRNFYGVVAINPQGVLEDGRTFASAKELRSLLLDEKEKFAKTLSRKLLSYALGRGIEFTDSPTVRELSEGLMASNFDSRQWMLDLVMSYPFRHRRSDQRDRYKDI